MKKYVLYLFVGIMVLLQAASVIKILCLERQLDQVQRSMGAGFQDMSQQVAGIYQNVDVLLEEQASMLVSAEARAGAFDASALTSSLTFTVVPKEITADTEVSLVIGGESVLMQREGTCYTAEVSCSIFEQVSPEVVISRDGVLYTEYADSLAIRDLKSRVLPELAANMGGVTSYGSSGLYKAGTLTVRQSHAQSGAAIGEVELEIAVDGETLSREVISPQGAGFDWESFDYEVKQNIPLSEGQTCTITVIAVDSLGLEHRYMVDTYRAGEGRWGGDLPFERGEVIYSSEGDLLWDGTPKLQKVGP